MRYAEMRYSDAISVNIFGQLSLILAYIGVILGGFVYACSRNAVPRALVLVSAFLPSVVVMITQSAKGLFILSVAMFYGATLVCRLNHDKRTLIGRETAVRALIGIVVVLPLIGVSFLSRGLYRSTDTDYLTEQLLRYFASYSSGHLFAFSDWFSHALGKPSIMEYFDDGASYGFYTFMAIFKAFGSTREVPPGTFDEYYHYGIFLQSNVYTMFRGLILDFGFVGTVVFTFLSGWLFHLSFHAMLVSKRPAFHVAVFVFMVAYSFNSVWVSMLMWNSIYVSFVLLTIILLANRLLKARDGGEVPLRTAH
jgi:oligosaccharide repeat unit polymerase